MHGRNKGFRTWKVRLEQGTSVASPVMQHPAASHSWKSVDCWP